MIEMIQIEHAGCSPGRIVAHCPYPAPSIQDDDRFNSITSARAGLLWVAGYNIATKSAGISSPKGCTGEKFRSEHAAVYDAIRRIRSRLSCFNAEDRKFVERLCDKAFDAVNPKLF